MKTIGISEFKAKCIEEVKHVQETGEPLLLTLRKQPIATVHPYTETAPRRQLGRLRGRMAIHGDIVHGEFDADWEMEA
jgi:antitoxin (DNA-binding transcriptional repressor) of toxin-antitoxin stability system